MVVVEGQDQAVRPGALAKRSQEESWAQWSLLRGMGSLPEGLADWLQQSGKAQLCSEAAVKEMHLSSSGWEVRDLPLQTLTGAIRITSHNQHPPG